MPAVDLSSLPHLSVASAVEVQEALQAANAAGSAIYPVGGNTSLAWGIPPQRAGHVLDLRGLRQVVDYPSRDMTITVEGGISLQVLQDTLAAERQRLPIDVPHGKNATLGGLVAANHSGPLRYGLGTIRDYVIGIRAVDGRGDAFAAGGRVVKNVAGYDFCKLLTGSQGTLGVITEVTLKVKPEPAARALVYGCPRDWTELESLLAGLVHSSTTPSIVEFLRGESWSPFLEPCDLGWLLVGFEGTEVEVEWMVSQLQTEWEQCVGLETHRIGPDDFASLYGNLVEFPADDQAELILQSTGVASGITELLAAVSELTPQAEVQAHAGNGVVISKFSALPDCGLATAVNKLRSVSSRHHGYTVVLSNPSGEEATHQCIWGPAPAPQAMVGRVKQAFDPHDVLNPGRFLYQGFQERVAV